MRPVSRARYGSPLNRFMRSTTCFLMFGCLLAVSSGGFAQDASVALIDTPEKAKAAQVAWATKLGKPVQWSNSAGMKFQFIPPGEFEMGSKDEVDAKPHRVRITQPFYLGTTEVTREQWEKIEKAQNSRFFPGPTQPMNYVDIYRADGFCAAMSKAEGITNAVAKYRLPTEAEWEFAARAGTSTRYYTGDTEADLVKAGWFEKNSGGTTHPVGEKAANAFGLYDVLGNVWEWTSDFYDPDFYTKAPAENPTLPKDEYPHEYSVLRGGSCLHDAKFCTAGHRDHFEPSRSLKCIGLRVVLPIKP